ncbi:SDR family oxidoreductase [Dokdonia donghaensis]|uniref:Short-chain dehydrogenase n=1 Tax=Dokdonia donghaensis DSW-1 TaxID=1300343 RepID=A0A0A2GTR9_9FLAO|nr:SDR family oxidoreductase [Dokdonia donghaensis]ANH61059.1 3-oxoacyl-[acyl-carrier-protein] reductase FabG [Dokdonia donghaensis DSW-1]KGO05716.1 short-chain dehydrogenase [Dokdonia donghaensis DSW-1]
MEDLKDKVALITGGTKGIGRGIAEALLHQGMKVTITGRDEKSTKEAATELTENDNYILGVAADVRDYESQQAAVKATLDKFGKIDVLIANAGLGHFENITDMTPQQWNETIDTNLTGVFYSVKASLEAIKESKGYMITISSLAGTNFFEKGTAYNASKFGLTGFSQALMMDVRQDDVKVTTIMPGSVSSHFGGRTPDEGTDWRIQPEDLGQLTVDLLKMHPRTLPSKVEVRPAKPPKK